MSQSREIDCRLTEAYIWQDVILEEAGCCRGWKLGRREKDGPAGKGRHWQGSMLAVRLRTFLFGWPCSSYKSILDSMVSAMLLSYLLLFFALTSSVTAQWDRLLHHRDSHLTEGNRYWYHMGRGKDKAKYPSWLLDHIFDDFIQFGTDADGVSTERRVSAISLFRLQRILQDPNKYCLHVSRMYNARTFHGPWKGNNGMGLKRNGFQMTGYWGRSTKLPVTVSDFWQAQ